MISKRNTNNEQFPKNTCTFSQPVFINILYLSRVYSPVLMFVFFACILPHNPKKVCS